MAPLAPKTVNTQGSNQESVTIPSALQRVLRASEIEETYTAENTLS